MKNWQKPFANVEVTTNYITYKPLQSRIRYKLFNNIVEIDLKEIIDKVLVDAGITGFNTKQTCLSIPYNIDDTASGDTLTLLVDKRRFHIRIPDMEIVANKQQKIDYDNTHPHRWSMEQWGKYIEKLFWDKYGFRSVELDFRGTAGCIRRGKVYGYIKSIINKVTHIDGLDTDMNSVVDYINWAFTNKSAKNSLTLGLLSCDGFIQDWVIYKRRNARVARKELSDKWQEKH